VKEHGFLLYYPRELVLANVKLQAEKELGRAFSALLASTEGYYRLGFLSEDNYLKLKEKYSTPLIQERKKAPTLKQIKAKEEKEKLNWTLGNVVEQWDIHPSNDWRKKWLNIAQRHPNLQNAIRVLALAKNEV
jgi:hypothetical protein